MASLIEFLSTMPFWYWWMLAAVLLTLELITGSTYLLWPAGAAAATGVLSLTPLGFLWQGQFLAFAAITIVFSIWQPRAVTNWLHRAQNDHFDLNDPVARQIGRRATVTEDFNGGAGKVRLDDTLWLAECVDGRDLPRETPVTVKDVVGTRLYVEQESETRA